MTMTMIMIEVNDNDDYDWNDKDGGKSSNNILTFCSIPSLNISKNLPKIKAKEVGHVMEAIVNLIQVSKPHLLDNQIFLSCFGLG